LLLRREYITNWLIPFSEVKYGDPGKDGIPSIDAPKFVNVDNATFLNDDDLVIGIVNENEVKAYPHKIFLWRFRSIV